MWAWSQDQEDPLEEGMEAHSNTVPWRIPKTEETGGLQSIESQRVRHDWNDLASMPKWSKGRGKEPPLWFGRAPGQGSRKQTINKHNPKAAVESFTPWKVSHFSQGVLEPDIKFIVDKTGIETFGNSPGDSFHVSLGGQVFVPWGGDPLKFFLMLSQWVKERCSQGTLRTSHRFFAAFPPSNHRHAPSAPYWLLCQPWLGKQWICRLRTPGALSLQGWTLPSCH